MRFLKPLNKKGFGHVELIVAILFVGIFSFVGYRVISSSGADGGYVCYMGPQFTGTDGQLWYQTVFQNRTTAATGSLNDLAFQGTNGTSSFIWNAASYTNKYIIWSSGFSGVKVMPGATIVGQVRKPSTPAGVGQGNWTLIVMGSYYKCGTTTNINRTYSDLTTVSAPAPAPAPIPAPAPAPVAPAPTTTAPKTTTTTTTAPSSTSSTKPASVITVTTTSDTQYQGCLKSYANDPTHHCILIAPTPSAAAVAKATAATATPAASAPKVAAKTATTAAVVCKTGYVKSTVLSDGVLKTLCSPAGCPVTDTSITTIANGKRCNPSNTLICNSGYVAKSGTCAPHSIPAKITSTLKSVWNTLF
jgi:hypothetical protein